ncbi:hypothetical protein PFICI_09501 [Pestalotiopsis fici W106-1]|uniref:NACHT domain-containing protein n=1 Tax=Pestalotiopsis fici (strain W106-1 / CGMCC3.15140) TaxID=1229662 RepID=W3X0I5_PESFW|nr:uncharacterized protein PFICI_09501 [Pestalotiopsis fici W106-1]ETS79648.1 hypothetical protein PFICI_09501 [Pestalotiopsis fici W106-1]
MSIDALSLACNIITVIDFGNKFYQSFRDIYENHKPDTAAEANANDLLLLAEKLKDSRKKAHQSALKNDLLFQIVDKCAKAATELQQEIVKLAPPGSSSRTKHGLQSLVSATKRTWRHNRIEQLKKSLDDCQATMQNAVLIKIYESGEAERVQRFEDFGKLDSRLRNFIQAVSKHELQMSELLAENRSLHQETQAVLRQEVAALRSVQIFEAEVARLKASLKFPGLNQRYNDLQTAHPSSLQWLLGRIKKEAGASDRDSATYAGGSHQGIEEEPKYLRNLREETFGDFKNWLISELNSKLYWVSGKPGAGKSTLMKSLFQQMESMDVIPGPHLVIRHFFWLGTTNTRSRHNDMKGMFLTFLHQLLESEASDSILQRIPHSRQKDTHTEWSMEELQDAVLEALQLLSSHYSIYVLIDALDEHLPVAKHGELLQVIRKLEAMPNMRLVVSSRREQIFEKGLSSSRQLHLQRLTAPDIHYFALDSLSNAMNSEHYKSGRFLYGIVETIVNKADGVFLWARLAVDGIKRGFVDGNSEDELEDRLNDMPAELFEYFKSIWSRLGDDEKRYQTRAGNIFTLLLSETWDRGTFHNHLKGPLNHMKGTDKDLLYLSLALDTDLARVLIQGDERNEKKVLLELCQDTERTILSSCAGLVELQEDKRGYCIPCNVEPMVLSKKAAFIHRTAREFLRETAEGKHVVDCNNLGEFGPDFRVLLAALARSVVFRGPRQVPRQCLPKRWLDLGYFLRSFRFLIERGSPLGQPQRYDLIDLCHRVYYRLSGHPDNPIFGQWRPVHPLIIYPFIAFAARWGHGDWVVQWMKAQVSQGRTFSPEAYVIVFRASLECGLEDDDFDPLSPDLNTLFTSTSKMNPCLPRCFVPSWEHSQISPLVNISLSSTPQEILREILLEMQRSRTTVVKRLIELLTRLGCDLFATVPWVYRSGEFPEKSIWELPQQLSQPVLVKQNETQRSAAQSMEVARVHMLFEASLLWLIQCAARTLAAIPEAKGLCHDLEEFVSLHGQSDRVVQTPKPILLFTAKADDWVTGFRGPTRIVVRDVKKMPVESKVQLGEIGQDGVLRWPLEQIWEDSGTEVLNDAQIEELLIRHKIWCSKADLKQLAMKCNIRMEDGAAPENQHDDWRLIVPPPGATEEQETLGYLTMPFVAND